MPKPFYQKKRFTRMKRSSRFKKGQPRFIIKKGRIIHFFKRTFKSSYTISGSATGFLQLPSEGTPRYNDWRLDQLPNYSDFTNLYDTYKICGIKRKYIFNRNSADSDSGNTTSELPQLITVNDFNDTAVLASESAALEYASCKINRLDRITKRYFRPKNVIFSAGTVNDQMVVKSQWLNTDGSADKPHHGLKEAVMVKDTNGEHTLGILDVYTTYYVACRTPR